MSKKFIWRHISDALLLTSDKNRKIFIKGKKNKLFVASVAEFLNNENNQYDFYWLPLSEQAYLFSHLHSAFLNYEKAFVFNGERLFAKYDKFCLNLN